MKFVNANFDTEICTEWLTYDDVLLLPQASDISSRNCSQVNTESNLTASIVLDTPIISANMDTVTGSKMFLTMCDNGGYGILHRFYTDKTLLRKELDEIAKSPYLHGISIGINGKEIDMVEEIVQTYGRCLVCVDVANGHMEQVTNQVRYLRDRFKKMVQIVAGNVGTHTGVRSLALAGADAIKVGIGPGSMCTTRRVTGHGVPQLTAIIQARKQINALGLETCIIADGGIRTSGDIIKALAAGADTVMIGNLFASTSESPGDLYIKLDEDHYIKCETADDYYEPLYKKYRGQASRDFMNDYDKSGVAAEGEDIFMAHKGSVVPLMEELVGGVRSGMSYSGARTLDELRQKAQFIRVSNHSFVEGTAHGK